MSVINILHLSDLHFGYNGTKDATMYHQAAIKEMEKELHSIPEKYPDYKPDIIAVTGDIGWNALKTDYDQAAVFLKDLMNIYGLSPGDVILCPGNHDIDRESNDGLYNIKTYEESLKYLSLDRVRSRAAPFKAYAEFSKALGIPSLKNGAESDSAGLLPYLYGHRQIKGVKFYVFNSAWNVREKKEKNMWLGSNLVLDQKLSGKDENSVLSVTLFHHPFDDLNEAEKNIYGQEHVVYDMIAEMSDLILTGHVHGAIRKSNTIKDKARFFSCSAAYDRDSNQRGCQIIRVDTAKRTFSTRAVCRNNFNEWSVVDIETDIALDSGASARAYDERLADIPPPALAFWLDPAWDQNSGAALPIDNESAVNLITYFAAKTAPFTAIIASDRPLSLVEALNNNRISPTNVSVQEAAARQIKWSGILKDSSDKAPQGTVIYLSADDPNDLNKMLLSHRTLREDYPDTAVIYNIFADSMYQAAIAAQTLACEINKSGTDRAEVMVLSLNVGLSVSDPVLLEKASEFIKALNTEEQSASSFDEEINRLLEIRDKSPALWETVISRHAKNRRGNHKICGFAACSHRESDLYKWFRAIDLNWFQQQERELFPCCDSLSESKTNTLIWSVYRSMTLDSIRSAQWKEIYSKLKEVFGTLSIFSFIDFAESGHYQSGFRPSDVSRWAHTASEQEYCRLVPILRDNDTACFWTALVSGQFGIPYILREYSLSPYTREVLSDQNDTANDPQWSEQLTILRKIIRPFG